MAQAEQQQRSTTTHRQFSADLLTRLNSYKPHFVEPKRLENDNKDNDEEEEAEIELSLGLSLNGRFGNDPRAKNDDDNNNNGQSLKRSSSVSDFALTSNCHVSQAALERTCSLPAETEEWRRRKEIQSLRRLEAKRKRSEKQRNNINNNNNTNNNSTKVARLLLEPPPIVVGSTHKDVVLPSQLSFQGSGGSYASGSSCLSESDSLAAQGQKCSEIRSPTSVQSLPDRGAGMTSFRSGDFSGLAMESQSSNNNPATAKTARSVLEDMPCVSTTGLGPNGKRIEGFLYRYSKGEEVRIVCVCHGSFWSPAEFVKHAGGANVDHPLKHIVVNPTSFL